MTKKKEITWKKSAGVIERTIDDEKVLLDLKTGVYYSLDETGSKIWELLEKPVSAEEIAGEILESYIGDSKAVLDCVNGLLKELAAEKLAKKGARKS